MRALLGLALCVIAAGACDDEPRRATTSAARPAKADVQGPIIARIDGEPVSLEDVQQTVDATGLSPADALARIEAETLLAEHARRSGYGKSKQDERAIEGARVRALLRVAVERGTAPHEIAAAEVKQRFDEVRKKQERPEGRAVTHVLFRSEDAVQDAKAEAAASELLERARLLSADERRRLFESYPSKSERDGLRVTREKIADARADAGLVPAFVQAIFGAKQPQLVSAVVRTSFGYHVINVDGVVPALTLNYSDVEPAIRQALSIEARSIALEQLVSKLRAESTVQFHEPAIASGLADDNILGAGM